MNAHKTIATVVTVSLTLTLASVAHAASIGIHWRGANNGTALASGDSAGAVPQVNWNNVPLKAFETTAPAGPATISSIVNNSNVTQVGMSVSLFSMPGGIGFEGWGNDNLVLTDATINTPDDRLMEGWYSPRNTGPTPDDLTITVTGIPYAYYDLYVYYVNNGTSTQANQQDEGLMNIYNNSGGTLLASSYMRSISTTNKFDGTMAGDVQNPVATLLALGAENTNVTAATRFSGLTSATLFLRTNAVVLPGAGTSWGPGIAGIQFVEAEAPQAVPEPSTFALATLAALSLGFFAWRKRSK